MYCGFGKSSTSMKLSCDIGLKTLIIVNKLILIKQWEEGIKTFCPNASVQKLTTKSKKDNCNFYIINAQNVEKMGKSFFSDIGTVIVDEAHLIMAETLSRCLQWVTPRYLIGLTATPYRVDGLNALLDLYFGKYKIIRTLWREHIAYKVSTGFKPTIELAQNGRVNWSSVLESQASDIDRNELIIKILKHYSERNFLVLTKRVAQGEYLVKRLMEEGENVTSLFGSNQEYNVTSRILVGTNSKCGTGFDHAKMDALLLACDLEQYFVQYLGRVFRTKDVKPIIFDLVDDYSLLSKHFNTRQKIYRELGGEVKNFDINLLKT
jgi:superfamily II DNA or RNA helicase